MTKPFNKNDSVLYVSIDPQRRLNTENVSPNVIVAFADVVPSLSAIREPPTEL